MIDYIEIEKNDKSLDDEAFRRKYSNVSGIIVSKSIKKDNNLLPTIT